MQTKFVDKDATLTLDIALDIARTEDVRSNSIKEISPSNSSQAPSFVCVDLGAPNTIFLNELFAPPTVQNAVLVKRESLGIRLPFIKV